MDEKQRKCLQVNHMAFIRDMADVDAVVDSLVSSDVLTPSMAEIIRAEKVRASKSRALHALMPMRGDKAFDQYYAALNGSGNEGLAKLLVPRLSSGFSRPPSAPEGQRDGVDGDRVMAEQAQGGPSELSRVPNAASETGVSTHQKQHIMISYQTDSKSTLLRVRDALKERGYNVWMDVDNLTGNIYDAMAAAVTNSSVVLVAASQKYTKSDNCKKELTFANERKKPIIPLLMEPNVIAQADDWFGFITTGRRYIKFTDDTHFDDSITELVKEIKALNIENNE